MNAKLSHGPQALTPNFQEQGNRIELDGLTLHFLPIVNYAYPDIEKGTIVIWEDIWTKKEDLVKARIASLLNKNKSIAARDTTLVPLEMPEMDSFLNANHLMGSAKVKYKYGLRYKGVLVAVASFSGVKTYYREQGPCKSTELVRYASVTGVNVMGGLSKLLEHFIDKVQPDDIMTYADREWSDGGVYETLGFKLVEQTSPNIFWVHPKEMIRYSAQRLPEIRLTEKLDAQSLAEFLLEQGYCRIHNAGNLKYLLAIN